MKHNLEDLIEAVGIDIKELTRKANNIEMECFEKDLKPSERIELYKKRMNKTELAFSLFIIEENMRMVRKEIEDEIEEENQNIAYM